MISIIVATGLNREIGANNELLWNLPNDLRHFKEKTMGKTIVMGRKTFESLPLVLPGRKHIVLSSNYKYDHKDVVVCNDYNKLLSQMQDNDEEVIVIGGEQIYRLFLPYADKIYYTLVEEKFPKADAFFPDEYIFDNYNAIETTHYLKDDRNEYNHTIFELEKSSK